MADVNPTPRIRCDNCGAMADKVSKTMPPAWERPSGWGSVRVDPTVSGMYPNRIAMTDLCPDCLKAVHGAVGAALEIRRAPPPNEPEAILMKHADIRA